MTPLKINIRAFRACDEPLKRDEYLKEFEQILLYYGVKKVTSQSTDWYENPDTWLVVAETDEDNKILAGARMQMATDEVQLPIEKAIGYKDSYIYSLVKERQVQGIGELCGLWNTRKLAGFNIGSTYLGIASIAIAPKIGMHNILALAAPSTRANCMRLGFKIIEKLGENGEFNYPKENLVATAMIISDPLELSGAEEGLKKESFYLRNNPNASTLETTPKGPLVLNYML